jgi:hypothetical protein
MTTLTPQQKYARELKQNNPDGDLACAKAPCSNVDDWTCRDCLLLRAKYPTNDFYEYSQQSAAAFIAKYGEQPDWEHAYKTLFATNEKHIQQLEVANATVNSLCEVARKKSDEVERLRAIIRRSEEKEMDDAEGDELAAWLDNRKTPWSEE